MAHVIHTMVDYSGEQSYTRHNLPDLTNANYAVVTGNTPVTQNVGALRVALGNITDMNFVRHTVVAQSVRAGGGVIDPNAQREIKALVRCQDNVNFKRFNIEIPAPRLDVLALPGTDEANTDATEWQDLAAALEANCVSPWGNAITISDGRIVGRRL